MLRLGLQGKMCCQEDDPALFGSTCSGYHSMKVYLHCIPRSDSVAGHKDLTGFSGAGATWRWETETAGQGSSVLVLVASFSEVLICQ